MDKNKYGSTQIDGKDADSLYFEIRKFPNRTRFDLTFYDRFKVVKAISNLDEIDLLDAVGEVNANQIEATTSLTGTLEGNQLQRNYGLSPEESKRREKVKTERDIAEYQEYLKLVSNADNLLDENLLIYAKRKNNSFELFDPRIDCNYVFKTAFEAVERMEEINAVGFYQRISNEVRPKLIKQDKDSKTWLREDGVKLADIQHKIDIERFDSIVDRSNKRLEIPQLVNIQYDRRLVHADIDEFQRIHNGLLKLLAADTIAKNYSQLPLYQHELANARLFIDPYLKNVLSSIDGFEDPWVRQLRSKLDEKGQLAPVISELIVDVLGEDEELEIVGSNVSEEDLQEWISSQTIVRAKTSDGRYVDLSFDMDFETIVVEVVENRPTQIMFDPVESDDIHPKYLESDEYRSVNLVIENTKNAAFSDVGKFREISRIFSDAAERIKALSDDDGCLPLCDLNGNRVGTAYIGSSEKITNMPLTHLDPDTSVRLIVSMGNIREIATEVAATRIIDAAGSILNEKCDPTIKDNFGKIIGFIQTDCQGPQSKFEVKANLTAFEI